MFPRLRQLTKKKNSCGLFLIEICSEFMTVLIYNETHGIVMKLDPYGTLLTEN